jgi:archaellum component FlaC
MPERQQKVENGIRRLAGAVQVLAASQLATPDGPPVVESLSAIAVLRDAPAEEVWNRGLLAGLRSCWPEVTEATVQAVVERLAWLSGTEQQDGLMAAILDACFLNLSGRPRRTRDAGDEETRRADRLERAAARLVQAVTHLLSGRDPGLEHHRSRLLARARELKHLAGRGDLAAAVVEFQTLLAEGERSDNLVAAEIALRRKLDLYTSPEATDSTLLAYLGQDKRLPLEKVTQELFQAYRMLLACQTKEHARRAILAALDNLICWLDQTPQTPRTREATFGEVIQRARVGVPRRELVPTIGRQLDAHLELLPGPDHPEDLLHQLVTRYDAAEGEDILVRGLALLRRLPLVRLRTEEICAFVLAPARMRRGVAVWEALLSLVESLVTGLADFVLTHEELGRREERRNRLLRNLLEHDRKLRELLYRLATDADLPLSHDAEIAARVRESAWRVLLRCLPGDRIELQREGVLGHGGRFLRVTLEESGQAHRRELWEVLLSRWGDLFGDAVPTDERRKRLQSLSGFFRRTREYTAVQDHGGALGPMLRLTFDDADPEARQMAEAALVESGYSLEVERERQRRLLLHLRDDLTTSNSHIVQLEDEVANLGTQAVTVQAGRVEHGLAVQELLQQRDILLTESWIFTSELQVDLEEVRVALVAAIAAADRELVLLRDLQGRMRQEHAEAQRVHGVIESLVRQQQHQESVIEGLRRDRQRAAASLAQAQSEASSLRSRHSSLASHPPSQPSRTGDAERDARSLEDYRRRVDSYQSELRDLSQRISRADGESRSYAQEIESCERRIGQAEAEYRRLQGEINQVRGRLGEIRRRVDRLAGEFNARQAAFEAIRREIRRLTARAAELQARQEAHNRQIRAAVGENTQQIDSQQVLLHQIQERLRDLSNQLNRTGHERDQQKTQSQRLVQAIDSGRGEYDRTAARAIPESANADAIGHSLREAHEREVVSSQESLVQYVEGMHHAIRNEPPSPVRGERRRRRQPIQPGQKTGGRR